MGKSRKRSKLSHTTGYPYKTGKSPDEKSAVQLHGNACFAGTSISQIWLLDETLCRAVRGVVFAMD